MATTFIVLENAWRVEEGRYACILEWEDTYIELTHLQDGKEVNQRKYRFWDPNDPKAIFYQYNLALQEIKEMATKLK